MLCDDEMIWCRLFQIFYAEVTFLLCLGLYCRNKQEGNTWMCIFYGIGMICAQIVLLTA